ncbi:GIY-YIG nuclease family protein [Patescibacteria group bacterium]|nr:GIY-YIG nuclease family protein [Patescibacteria group bacterium]
MLNTRSYFVYILTNSTNRVLYIGVTNNLIRRIYEHKQNAISGFTAQYHLHKLVYFEIYNDIKEAIQREKRLKGGSRLKKLELIRETNPDFQDLTTKII